MTPEDARRRIAAIRTDLAHPFFAESHPEHGRAVRDVEALYVQAYPEPVENPFDRPPPMKAPPPGRSRGQASGAWQLLGAIRTDPSGGPAGRATRA